MKTDHQRYCEMRFDERLTEDERQAMDRICASPGCYRQSGNGVILCNQCMYGNSPRAADDAVKAKKKWERLNAKEEA